MSTYPSARAPGDLVVEAFGALFGVHPAPILVRAPGRVNLIGDHTDYNEGFVLPMTLAQAAYAAIRLRTDRRIRLHALNFGESLESSLDALPGHGTAWPHYVLGVTQLAVERDLLTHGFDAVVFGDVPVGSGLSSSAALEVATLLALEEAGGFALSGREAARLCQEVEHRFVGVQCGIMDQLASRMGQRGHALLLDCRSLDIDSVPLGLDDHVLVVTDSRAPRSLAGSKYNERRAECEQGVRWFQATHPDVRSLRDVPMELYEAQSDGLPDHIADRCLHVISENERVRQAARALRDGDTQRLGALMTASHASLRDRYLVSSPQLDLLVSVALDTPGVAGSRLTGAGFGGCTVTLALRDAVDTLAARLRSEYRAVFGLEATCFVVEDNVEAGRLN